MKKKTYVMGNISESVVLKAYLQAGLTVSVPFGNGSPYDLVVDNGCRLYRFRSKPVGFIMNAFCIGANED